MSDTTPKVYPFDDQYLNELTENRRTPCEIVDDLYQKYGLENPYISEHIKSCADCRAKYSLPKQNT